MDLNDIGGFLKLAASLIPALWGRTLIVLGIASMFQNAYGGIRIKGEGGAPGRPTVGQYASFWSAVVAAGASFGGTLLIIVCIYYGMYPEVYSTWGDAFGKLVLGLLLWLPLCIWGSHLVRLNLDALAHPGLVQAVVQESLGQRRALLSRFRTLSVLALLVSLLFGITATGIVSYLLVLYLIAIPLVLGSDKLVVLKTRHSVPVVIMLCILAPGAALEAFVVFGFATTASVWPGFPPLLVEFAGHMMFLFELVACAVVLVCNDHPGRRLLGWVLSLLQLGCIAGVIAVLPAGGEKWATYGRFIGAASFVAPIVALSVWLRDLPRATGSRREVEGAASPGLF